MTLDAQDGTMSYDSERYDPDEPDVCQQCGADLHGAGDRSTLGMHCPDCETLVWVK